MSYPRKIHPLVVEDELAATGNYREMFKALGARYALAPPRFAHSFEDAEAALRNDTIFHLLVLDLGLPLHRSDEAQPGVEPGLRVLELAAARHSFPVPAVVVISGRLNQAKIPGLTDRLQQFHHGAFVAKGIDDEAEVEKAIVAVHRYCDVGVHIRDADDKLCPTLSPREEDVLRRCVVAQAQCVGVDLQWWGTYSSRSSMPRPGPAGVTKVLVGRFMLDDGMEFSHPTFFKFEPAENATYAQRDVAIMHQKLSHVKVARTLTAGPRCLLVTQKVGDSIALPVPLCDFLRGNADGVLPLIPGLVADVAAQLGRLGEPRSEYRPRKEVLWPHHTREWIERAWMEHTDPSVRDDPSADPLALFDELRADARGLHVMIRACNHGDLNSTNVALDIERDAARAYIFDAGGVKGDVSVRDLANLEVTAVLHHPRSVGPGLVQACADLYADFVVMPATFDPGGGADLARNTRALVAAIRQQAAKADPSVYALMVFDVVLQQLGGLAFDPSRNKISSPREAALLAARVTQWCRRHAYVREQITCNPYR